MLGEIKAFSDNVVVRSTLSYIFTLTAAATGQRPAADDRDDPFAGAAAPRALPSAHRRQPHVPVFPTGKVLFSRH